MKFFRRKVSTIRSQIISKFILAIVLITFATTLTISLWVAESLEQRVLNSALRTTNNISNQSALALAYGSPENATEFVEAYLSYPDIEQI